MGAEEGSTQHSKGPKLKVTGDTAALKDNVYPFGAKNQADMYIKMTEAIADCWSKNRVGVGVTPTLYGLRSSVWMND